jgi:(R,R)-butanediol dehydrogenase / meso-butanediol dehydrogenase / diacetyl reductase
VLIMGGGPIGLAVAVFSKLAGARDVIVSEYAPARREAAGALGATAAIDPAKEDVAEAFSKKAGGPPDVIFECVGVPERFRNASTSRNPLAASSLSASAWSRMR